MTNQQVCDYILSKYTTKRVPVKYSNNLRTYWGLFSCRYRQGITERKITLSRYWCDLATNDENLSVLIHEICHAIVHFQNKREYGKCHTPYFFELSDYWHKEFGLKEERTNKTKHGKVTRIAPGIKLTRKAASKPNKLEDIW